ncbi:MAG TPA: hypothetical protein VMR16_01830 [Candidatus Saccharimonadales bacterium]|nr:hypothetical protein [Candidatus Saccharimonadales bacterium]
MKISKKVLSVGLVLAVLIFSTALIKMVSAQSDEPTNAQIQLVRANCLTLKSTLNQLHASDALLRVNMGQSYESLSIKLMSGFNDRIANNNLNNDTLASTTNSYNSALNDFRTDYQTYEEQMSSALNIDCTNQPSSFYDAVSLARTYRDRVHVDIVNLNQFITQYQSAIDQFENDYLLSLDGTTR